MSYIKVLNANGIEAEERKKLRENDPEYNYVLEQAVKITRENHNRDNPNDMQTYEVVNDSEQYNRDHDPDAHIVWGTDE